MVGMDRPPLRIAAISLHTSPLQSPGSADAGGMNVVVLEQARAMARRGHRVDLMTRRTDPDTPAVLEAEPGIRLITIDAAEPAPLAKSDMDRAIAPFSEGLERVLGPEGEGPYDLVHAHHWFSGVAAAGPARRHGLPVLQSFHSVAAPDGARTLAAGEAAESPGRIAGERACAREAAAVVAVSGAEAATIIERYGTDPEAIAIVRPGVDVEAFAPASTAELEQVAPTLLFAARLQPLKAPELAIEVLARLGRPEVHLVLAGGDSADFPDMAAQLADRARALGVADQVELVGSADRARLAELMRTSRALLLPSWSETFGLVALEAQASATPVIAWSGSGGVAEAVGPGGTVLDSRDPDVWATAAEEILDDAARHGDLAAASRAFALTRTWDASAADLEEVCRAVLAGAPLPRRLRPSQASATASGPDPEIR